MHAEDAVLVCRVKRDVLAAEGLADPPGPIPEADEAVAVDLADVVAGSVVDCRRDG